MAVCQWVYLQKFKVADEFQSNYSEFFNLS
jgi:hypothetical protein